MKAIKLLIVLGLIALQTSCVHRSILTRENDQHKKHTVQYCGGQLWGYVEALDESLSSKPYVAIYTHLTEIDRKEALLLHVALHFKNSAKLEFAERSFNLKVDNLKPESRPLNFVAIPGYKTIDLLFPSQTYVTERGARENEYLVFKKKYGGFFGQMKFALEDPFVFKIPKKENIEIKDKTYIVNFDKDVHDEFYVYAVPILFLNQETKNKSSSGVPDKAKIEITLPSFQIEGQTFKTERYTFNFDRNKIIENSKDSNRCPSLEMMFHWSRSSILLPKFIID